MSSTVYQLNIFQTLIFMFKVKNNMVSNIFNNSINTITHKYPTKYSINFNEPLKLLNIYTISARGPHLWNNVLDDETKNKTSLASFKVSSITLKKTLFVLGQMKQTTSSKLTL